MDSSVVILYVLRTSGPPTEEFSENLLDVPAHPVNKIVAANKIHFIITPLENLIW